MNELYVFCEGSTEQAFCRRVLEPFLFPNFDGVIHPVKIAHSRRHNIIARGGIGRYQPMKNEMVREFSRHVRPGVLFTSMIDLYALSSDFPGKSENSPNPDNPRPYVEALEFAFAIDLNEPRFVPHLQLHEFETLIFVDPGALKRSFPKIDEEVDKLTSIAKNFGDVEKINDTAAGAPSKRIIQVIPQYEKLKRTVGPDAVAVIGMTRIIGKCRHFGSWIASLQTRLGSL